MGAFFLPHAVAASATVSRNAVTQMPVGTLRRMNLLLVLRLRLPTGKGRLSSLIPEREP